MNQLLTLRLVQPVMMLRRLKNLARYLARLVLLLQLQLQLPR